MKSREKFLPQKVPKIQSITEKLKEESQLSNKGLGKSMFDRLFNNREVVIVKKEKKRKSRKNAKVKITESIHEPKSKLQLKNKKLLLPLNEGIVEIYY